MLPLMRYAEVHPPASLQHAIKLGWTLELDGHADEVVDQSAMPDGCIEIIRRLQGSSFWRSEQPEIFVAGITSAPTALHMSGDGRFIGIRLWPWAWNSLATLRSPALVDTWRHLKDAAPQLNVPLSLDGAMTAMGEALASFPADPLYAAILGAQSVSELAQRSGRSHRWLQRWFERNIGISPRKYLRLLRFSQTLGGLPGAEGTLAGHAADHGFADQAHMSREFRAMAGAPAAVVRKIVTGPFLDGSR